MKTITTAFFAFMLSLNAFSYCQVDTAITYSYPNNGVTRQFSGRNIFSYNADSTLAQEIYQSFGGGAFSNASRVLYTYNGSKQMTEEVIQSYSTTTNSWSNSKQNVFTYTAGKLTVKTRSDWDNASSSWKLSERNVYAYDASGNPISEGYEQWNIATSAWRGVSRITRTFSPTLTQEVTELYSPVTLTWRNSTKVDFTRNGLSQLSQTLTYNWNATTSVWDLAKRNLFTYTSIFNTGETEERKATPTSSWVFFSKAFSRYNTTTFTLLERNYLEFDAVNNQWDSVSRKTYEYNATSDLIAADNFSAFSSTSDRYMSRYRTENGCRQINVGMEEIDITHFSLYPNPVNENKLTISTTSETPYTLFDLSGKTLLAGELKTGENTLQLQDFSTGIYLIRVGNSTKRFIKN